MEIIRANIDHLEDLAPLFNGYRVFYSQVSDVEGAKKFLHERLKRQDSVIFMAYNQNKAIGFTQLYPLFSSVSMEPMLLLNDLFIDTDHRNQSIGTALIEHSKEYCRQNNQKGMSIQTEQSNKAQNLYLRLGFEKDPDLHFFWKTK